MNDRQANRTAAVVATAMGVSLAGAFLWAGTPVAAAAEQTRPLASLQASVRPSVSTVPVLLARSAASPCEATTARYKAAQAALGAGDIDAADDVAVIAEVLIADCGWSRVDAALGGPHG